MLNELASMNKTVGVRQSRKAIRDGRAARLFVAVDADAALTGELVRLCAEKSLPVVAEFTQAQLGSACGIAVGAAAVVELKK